MITARDRLGWDRLLHTIQSGVWYKLVYAYSLGIIVFIIGNLGTRIIFLGSFKQFLKERFLLYFVVLSLILPMLFIQKGNAWNIVQFLYYGLLVLNIFAGIALSKICLKLPKIAGFGLVILTIILTIPTTLSTFPHYLPDRPPAKISVKELEALNFLKKQPAGTVLTLPYDSRLKDKYNPPLPLEVYESTSYVSAFSKKPVFLEDIVNPEIIGVDYRGRLNTIRDFMRIKDQSSKILKDNNITYVYAPSLYNFQVDEGRMGLKNIFSNEEVKIYKVL
jgi:hypothetical protein